jgi:hypothetical protein
MCNHRDGRPENHFSNDVNDRFACERYFADHKRFSKKDDNKPSKYGKCQGMATYEKAWKQLITKGYLQPELLESR